MTYNRPMGSKVVNILLTNDDGVDAPGLRLLRRVLEPLGEVTVVAPATEQSGVGHAITYREAITARKLSSSKSGTVYAVDGTPADCVKFGILEVLGEKPDIVCSGINPGLNLGCNIFYSGTVAAAIEGTMYGVRAVAFSSIWTDEVEADVVASGCLRVFKRLLNLGNERAVAYNVNLPPGVDGNCKMVFTEHWDEAFMERYLSEDTAAERGYRLDLAGQGRPSRMCDVTAVEEGAISITPMRPRLTDIDHLGKLKVR